MEPIQTPGDLLAIIKRRKWDLLIPMVSIFLISVIIAIVLPPTYKATTTILIEQQDVPLDYVKAAVSTYAEQQMQIINQRIMSTERLLYIINRLNLYPDLKDTMQNEEIINRMRKSIVLDPISVNVVDPRTGRQSSATIAFTISYEGKRDPRKVLEVANELASFFLEENSKIREQKATGVSKFLQDELGKLKADLDRIDTQISLFKKKHSQNLPEMMQINMQSINETQQKIDLLENQLIQLKERDGDLKTQLASTPRSFTGTEGQRLNELKLRLVNLKNQYSEVHPDVIKTKAEITELEERLKSSLNNDSTDRPDNPAYITLASELSRNQSDIATTKAQIRDLNTRLNEYKRHIELTPQVESEYKTLMMERENTQTKYDDLSRKHMESMVSQGLEKEQKGERFTIIDPARLPEKPYKPNKFAIMFLGLVLGIGVGVGTAAAREYTDTSVRNANTLEQVTSYPVLASIPVILLQNETVKRGRSGIRDKWMRVSIGFIRDKWMRVGIALFLFALCGLIIIHFFVMDLYILWAKLNRFLGI